MISRKVLVALGEIFLNFHTVLHLALISFRIDCIFLQVLIELLHFLQQNVPSGDDIVAIINLLDQMTALISRELQALAADESQLPSLNNKYDSLLGSEPNSLGMNPCLDILLSENILSHVLASSRMPITPEQQDCLRLEQIKLYEVLLGEQIFREIEAQEINLT